MNAEMLIFFRLSLLYLDWSPFLSVCTSVRLFQLICLYVCLSVPLYICLSVLTCELSRASANTRFVWLPLYLGVGLWVCRTLTPLFQLSSSPSLPL